MDDFYIIAQETHPSSKDAIHDTTGSETQVKSLTKFLRNITGGTTSASFTSSNNLVGNASLSYNSTSQMVNSMPSNIKYNLA